VVLLLSIWIFSCGDHGFSPQSDDRLQTGVLQCVQENSVIESQCMPQTAPSTFLPIYREYIPLSDTQFERKITERWCEDNIKIRIKEIGGDVNQIHLKILVFWGVTMCKLFTQIYTAPYPRSLEYSSAPLSEIQTLRGFRISNAEPGKLLWTRQWTSGLYKIW
jgi:hypothetical protein